MGSRRSFRITVHPEGIKHTLTVHLYPDRATLREYLGRVDATHQWDDPKTGDTPTGAFWAPPFTLGDSGHSGTIILNETDLTLNTFVHECTHAAQHIYAMRYCAPTTRALKHMHGSNEPFAYLVGDLSMLLTRRIQAAGFIVSS